MSKDDRTSHDRTNTKKKSPDREESGARSEEARREEKQKISRADVARNHIEEARGGRRRDGKRRRDDEELEALDPEDSVKEKRREYIEEGDSRFGELDTKSSGRSDESTTQHRDDEKLSPDPAPDEVDEDLRRHDPKQ